MHVEYIGDGMLDAAVCGEIFCSPTAIQVLSAIKSVPNKNGVLLIVKNYTGDRICFKMAAEMAKKEGKNKNKNKIKIKIKIKIKKIFN